MGRRSSGTTRPVWISSVTAYEGKIPNARRSAQTAAFTPSRLPVDSFQYTAREFDSEAKLDYYRFRYYDPSRGRFLSEDFITFDGGIDFYRYVANSP